jgi:glycosyltransferase involved in cell wall biosynthesis
MSKKNNLLIINQHSSYITIDIANAFADSRIYDKIVLMAGMVNVREVPLTNNIKVVKTIPYLKNNIFSRLFSWVTVFLHLLLVIYFKYRSYKVFMISNPPLISFLPYFCRTKYSVLIFDVYPDALISNGFFTEDAFLSRLWEKANQRFYKKSEKVFTISAGMKESISKYCDKSKIEVVSLWSSFPPTLISKKDNEFVRQLNLGDKFIIMYSGNMGKELGLEIFLDVAQDLIYEKDFLFMFIGEGWHMPELIKQVKERSITNWMFLPYQSASILKHSLSAADLSIVSLPSSNSLISIPNKVYTLLALARPMICISDANSDLSRLVDEYDFGRVFGRFDVDKIVSFIQQCRSDHHFWNELSHNALNCSEHFSKENATLFVS